MSVRPITYGCKIRLKHSATSLFLKSVAKNYIHPAGSFQQIVGANALSDSDAIWLVKGSDGSGTGYRAGETVNHGDIIRLEHVATAKNLHSHSKLSPLTRQQEVTAYSDGRPGIGDGNDNWRVDLGVPGPWLENATMCLDFRSTARVLHSHSGYAHPALTAGLQEVTAYPRDDANDMWQAEVVTASTLAVRTKAKPKRKFGPKPRADWPREVFISHSARDVDLAAAVVKLLRAALQIRPKEIRCSSVAGYKFVLGAGIDEQIKKEVASARTFIALVTPRSLASPYVMFEMGARWGQRLHLSPLIARGAHKRFLKTPVAGLLALSAGSEPDLHQFLGDLARQLGRPLNAVSVFLSELKIVRRLANTRRVRKRKRARPT
ncbi:MAG TPA: MIR domain-containing protein [Lacunisphaera sp.]|nr:MIR domain-containing protein [Lacunisphaera sp.]